ncbi:MAG TPA: hypothetical protein VH679_01040 [Vicinamibacterales bacterium]|jgi:hypothetical protein
MRHATAKWMLIGVMAGSTVALPAAPDAQSRVTAATARLDTAPPTHAVRGVVKSIEPASLVIVRSRRKPSDMIFVLTSSTLRAGTIVAGATVSVRYRTDDKVLVATAVTVDTTRSPQ